MPDPVPPEFARALDAARARLGSVGHPLYYFHETTSTNDVASSLAERGASEGTTVLAGAQTSGRGRLGRQWYSPPGAGLYLSVVIRSRRAALYLTLAGGVAVAEGIRAATGLPLEIKWPNDVVTPGTSGPSRRRKLAGILAEASSAADGLQHVILGIGINLSAASYPPELADRASSIETELGRHVEAPVVLAEVLAALAAELAPLSRGDAAGLLMRWRHLAPTASGTAVECDTPHGRLVGLSSGIADDGALLVKVGNRLERVIAGEVLWK